MYISFEFFTLLVKFYTKITIFLRYNFEFILKQINRVSIDELVIDTIIQDKLLSLDNYELFVVKRITEYCIEIHSK